MGAGRVVYLQGRLLLGRLTLKIISIVVKMFVGMSTGLLAGKRISILRRLAKDAQY